MKGSYVVFFIVSASAMFAFEKPDLSGKWRPEKADADSAQVLQIEEKDGKLHIRDYTGGTQRPTEVTCTMRGKSCKGTIHGDPATVSYWFNGTTLVEMMLQGKDNEHVIKTRRTLSGDGKRMTVEVMPITPPGKMESTVLIRVDPVSADAPVVSDAR